MKVLVTGGAGFIGSHTVDLLINEGHEVTILDKFEEQVHQGKTPDYINPKANLIKGDLGNIKVIENALKGVDSILQACINHLNIWKPTLSAQQIYSTF